MSGINTMQEAEIKKGKAVMKAQQLWWRMLAELLRRLKEDLE